MTSDWAAITLPNFFNVGVVKSINWIETFDFKVDFNPHVWHNVRTMNTVFKHDNVNF